MKLLSFKKMIGFTLIELLIVVAIIAILAAIAVPNFLEAQMRSKVSRLMTDMRTISKAMDMYRLDNNDHINWRYPDRNDNPNIGGGGFYFIENLSGDRAGIGWMLTTPVTYMTNIPYDEFWRVAAFELYNIRQATVLATMSTPGGFGYTVPLIPVDRYEFFLTSPGPNYKIWAHDRSTIYDPTNGTVSNGDIHFLHPIGFIGGYDNQYAGYDN